MNDITFSDAALRQATKLVRQSMLDSLPSPDECQAEFSPEFLDRMKTLLEKTQQKTFMNKFVHRVAVVLLSALIGLSAWLTVDVEAREALFGWLREVYENSLIYRPSDTTSTNSQQTSYHLLEIPDNYIDFMHEEDGGGGYVLYRNDTGQYLRFHYMFSSDGSAFLVDKQNSKLFSASVNGIPADLLLSEDSQTANAIIWATDDGTAFCISAFLTDKELIALAESVEPAK